VSGRRRRSKSTRVLLTQRALSDLSGIERYSVEQWGRRTAERYLAGIEGALDRLRDNPDILRQEPEFSTGLYFYRINKHLLICDVRSGTVTVLTVMHTSMDVPARLAELEPRLLMEAEMLRARLERERGE
jgi:toxin ParE1/3/4